VSGLAPVIAPLAGSALLLVFPWRGIFWVLAAYGLVVVAAAIIFIVETLPAHHRRASSISARSRYRALFSDRQFVGIAIVSGMVFSGLFAYLTTSPFLFQDHFHFTAQQYGLLFAINSVGVIIGVQSASRLARHIGPQWIIAVATVVQVLMAAVIVIDGLLGAGVWGILIPLWFFVTSCAFCFPCNQAIALVNHGSEAGTAASVLGAANFGIAGLLSPLIGLFPISNAIAMGAMMIGTATIAIAALWLLVRPRSVAALAH
jgi:MFS transporter, DHA1 family, multidrug resistance protein